MLTERRKGYEGFNEILPPPPERKKLRKESILGRKKSTIIDKDALGEEKLEHRAVKTLHYWRLHPPLDYDPAKDRLAQSRGALQYGQAVFKVKVEKPSWTTISKRYESPIKVYDGQTGVGSCTVQHQSCTND